MRHILLLQQRPVQQLSLLPLTPLQQLNYSCCMHVQLLINQLLLSVSFYLQQPSHPAS
jgi:hypothetical protein